MTVSTRSKHSWTDSSSTTTSGAPTGPFPAGPPRPSPTRHAPKPPPPAATPTPTTGSAATASTPTAASLSATTAAYTTSAWAEPTPEPPSSSSSPTSTSGSSTPPPAKCSATSPSTPPATTSPPANPRPPTTKTTTARTQLRVRTVRDVSRHQIGGGVGFGKRRGQTRCYRQRWQQRHDRSFRSNRVAAFLAATLRSNTAGEPVARGDQLSSDSVSRQASQSPSHNARATPSSTGSSASRTV
jgi:hypothetical protein